MLDSLKNYDEKMNEAEIDEAKKLLVLKHPLDDWSFCPIWKALPFLEPISPLLARWYNSNQMLSLNIDTAFRNTENDD